MVTNQRRVVRTSGIALAATLLIASSVDAFQSRAPASSGSGGAAASSGRAGAGDFNVDLAPPSLKSVPTPLPDDLFTYVKDWDAAVALGKLAFWDTQFGSDGQTACATCHYHAGTNNRFVNSLGPNASGAFDTLSSGAGGGPNYELNSGDFPFHRFLDRGDEDSPVIATSQNRVGATGVRRRDFVATTPGDPVDDGDVVADTTFHVGGVNVRQSTGRNAPTVINSQFMFRLFADGRAEHHFNGKNIHGHLDTSARILRRATTVSGTPFLDEVPVLLNNAATASQAVGPILSDAEMSWLGRSWEDVGHKMLPMKPLANQVVHPTDSVLGPYVVPGPTMGIDPALTYADFVMAAFNDEYWDGPGLHNGFTQMENNFSFYFGLAILCYESTLRSDDTPFDRWREGNWNALSTQQLEGLDIFINRGDCFDCHAGSVFGGASIPELFAPAAPGEEAGGILERMGMENTCAEGHLSMSTDPLPGQEYLAVDPTNTYIAIMPPASSPDRNRIVAMGIVGVGCPQGHPCFPEFDEEIDLGQGDGVPRYARPGFSASARLRHDGYCGTELEVSMESCYPGIPAGDYRVFFGFPTTGWSPLGVISIDDAAPPAVYDSGFYNIGVSLTDEDIGIGASNQFGPLSNSLRAQLGLDTGGFDLGIVPPPQPGERVAVNGSRRTPSLRNIALTGPYMWSGGMATLEQVVDFYIRGNDFQSDNIDDLDPAVSGIGGMNSDRRAALLAFLRGGLTDPRVLHEMAPFDHPSLLIPNGHTGDHTGVTDSGNGEATDEFKLIPAVGAAGGPPLIEFADQLDAWITAFPSSGLVATEGDVLPDPAAEVHTAVLDPFTVAIRLDKKPTADVVIDFFSSDPSQATASPAQLTFTPDNWEDLQFVHCDAVEDGVDDGDVPISMTCTITSSDGSYAGFPLGPFDGTVVDID